jgi:hypothetical protein
MSDGKLAGNPTAQLTGSLAEAWGKLEVTNSAMPPPLPKCRVFLTGEPGTMKTTLCSQIPTALLIDLEGGAHSAVAPVAHRIWVPVYQERQITTARRDIAKRSNRNIASLEGVLDLLRREARDGNTSFECVVFDSGDRLQDLVIEQLSAELGKDVREAGHEGSGWRKVRDRFMNIVREVADLGYGCWVTGHLITKTKTIGGIDKEETRPAMTPGIFGSLVGDCELNLITFKESKFERGKGNVTKFGILSDNTQRKRSSEFQLKARVRLPDVIGDVPIERAYETLYNAYESARAELG